MSGGERPCPLCRKVVKKVSLPDHIAREHGERPSSKEKRPLRADGGQTISSPDASGRIGYREALMAIQRRASGDEIGNGMAALAGAILSEDWRQAIDACRHLLSYSMRRWKSEVQGDE